LGYNAVQPTQEEAEQVHLNDNGEISSDIKAFDNIFDDWTKFIGAHSSKRRVGIESRLHGLLSVTVNNEFVNFMESV